MGLKAITYRKSVEVEERAGPDGALGHRDGQGLDKGRKAAEEAEEWLARREEGQKVMLP